MTAFVVRCPNCAQGARVPAEAQGQTVECPRCGVHFPARPAAAARNPYLVPVPAPARPAAAPDHDEPDHHLHHPHGLLVAVALLPFAAPLVWLAATALAVRPVVFSFVAPVAVAVGAGGLCGGLAAVKGWGFATRLRAMLAVVLLGYAAVVVLFFAKPGWIEVARRLFQGFGGQGVLHQAGDKSYSVRFPGPPTPGKDSPLPGWRLNEVATFADPRRAPETFVAAHGFPRVDFPITKTPENEAKFFAEAREALLKASGGTIVSERAVPHGKATVREYEVALPGGVTKRFVRMAKVERDEFDKGPSAFYLAVEGPFFLKADSPPVQDFFRSFMPK